jgi:hypothetical protein
MRKKSILGLLVGSTLAACGGYDGNQGTEELETTGTAEQDIAKEVPGAQLTSRIYGTLARGENLIASYASGDVGGCTGSMIGPEMMITASHCGHGDRSITFRSYFSDGTPTGSRIETFNCLHFLHTFNDTDMNLYRCLPNAAGERPGDKYGYLDFDLAFNSAGVMDYDLSKARAAAGTEVVSTWWNPVDSIGGVKFPNAMLFSMGKVARVDWQKHWFSPFSNAPWEFQCDNGTSTNFGTEVDLWSNSGCSGSTILSRATSRVLVGPTSTSSLDAPNRRALAISDYLMWGWVFSTATSPCAKTSDQLTRANITAAGLTPTNFEGWVDDNLDGMFDIQRGLEARWGEATRTIYWLGFESNRRNRMWNKFGTGVFFDPDNAWMEINASSLPAGGNQIMSAEHRLLNLRPGRTYRISYTVWTSAAGDTTPVRWCMNGSCSTANPPLNQWQRRMTSLTSSSAGGTVLSLQVSGGSRVFVKDVNVLEDGTGHDFDTHDMRFSWRNNLLNKRAHMWPIGNGAGVDWAAAVLRTGSSTGVEYSLSNEKLAVTSGNVRVCFDHRLGAVAPASGIQGRVHATFNGAEVAGSLLTFSPGANWTRVCTNGFNQGNSVIEFGSSSGAIGTGYIVDNVVIQRI